MTNHHPGCEDATGAYPGSCTCGAIKRKNYMGEKVDGHCPYDEATLREDKVNPGFICPICWTHYDTIGDSHDQ